MTRRKSQKKARRAVPELRRGLADFAKSNAGTMLAYVKMHGEENFKHLLHRIYNAGIEGWELERMLEVASCAS